MSIIGELKEKAKAFKDKFNKETQRIADRFGVTKKLVLIIAVAAVLFVLAKLDII
jgi:hypothetical protein